jgi:hypothetical protein
MDRVEQALVRECLRQLMRAEQSSGIGTREYVVGRLEEFAPEIDPRDALNYTYTTSVRATAWDQISDAALSILVDKIDQVMNFFQSYNTDILRILCKLYLKYRRDDKRVQSRLEKIELITNPDINQNEGIAEIIFSNWKRRANITHGSLRTGLYQTFRRYKPTREQKLSSILYKQENPQPPKTFHDWSKDENHAVICELLYLNFENMECKMITGDFNLYHGILCIAYDDILYALLQRPGMRPQYVHQRLIASRIEGADLGVHSAICLKIGNLTIRPIAADMCFLFLEPEIHEELYRETSYLLSRKWDDRTKINDDSVIADYISITPPVKPHDHPDWARVKYLKDFPILKKMGFKTPNYIALFREPLRTLAASTLSEALSEAPLDPFRQSRFGRET